MMGMIPKEYIKHFENMIYLPMVMSIFRKDRTHFEEGVFKLKGPYLQLVEQACKIAEQEYWETKDYLSGKELKVEKGKHDGFETEYIFYYDGFNDKRIFATGSSI